MKKLLTMLLALSVVFTFTFGSTVSVFAYTNTTNEFNANVNQAEAQVLSELNTVYSNVIKSLADDTNVTADSKTVAMDKAALEVAAKEYYDTVVTAIRGKSNDIKNDAANTDATIAALVAMYTDTTAGFTKFMTNFVTYTENKAGIDKAARAQFAVEKADAIAILNSIDLTKFSTVDQKIKVGDDEKTTNYKALATKEVEELVKKVEAVTVTDTATLSDVATALGKIGTVADTKASANGKEIMAAVENIYDKAKENVVGYQFVKTYRLTAANNIVKAVIKTADEEALADTQLEAEKTAAIANVTSKAATFQSAIAALPEAADRAEATAVKDAFVEAWTYNINACKTTAALQELVGTGYANIKAPTTTDDEQKYTLAKYADNKEKLEAIKTYAKKYAAEYDVNGNLVRDAAKIEKVLKAAEVAMYAANATEWDGKLTTAIKELHVSITDPYVLILTYCVNDDTVDAYALNNKIATLEAQYDALTDTSVAGESYYALELEKVRAIYDAKIAEYKAAKTMTEFNKIKGVDLTGIDTAAKVRTNIEALANYSVQSAKVKAYQDVLNADLTGKDGYRDFSKVTAKIAGTPKNMTDLAYWTNFYAENGARTTTEIANLYAKAVAAMEAVPTTKELKDQKAAVEALISALPATITLADKPAIKAAWEAMENYKAAKGSNDISNAATLLLDIKSVEALEEKAVKKALEELDLTTTTVTIADKEKVAAVVALYDAYKADWATDEMYNTNAVNEYSEALLEDAYGDDAAPDTNSLLGKIRALEKDAVKDAINAIPLNVELKDKATVEAARAAYDAYVAAYSYTYDVDKSPRSYDASNEIGITALKKAEDAIIVAQAKEDAINKYTDKNAKADLLDMARKVTIWRTSKTSIKVTAVGSVKNIKANGYTVKYTFYKKAPGAKAYKAIKTTTSNKYTYTNLKKGTNKFQVKVKVYDAEGKLVASKMTYYRAAKVK